MAEFNTVCLSGVLSGDVETYKKQGLQVARFFVDVEAAGDSKPRGNFKIVAFGDTAEIAIRNLRQGSHVLVVGALLERRKRGEVEIRARRLLLLPEDTPESEDREGADPHTDESDEKVEEIRED
jgi:single-stranded DNA-binding protein